MGAFTLRIGYFPFMNRLIFYFLTLFLLVLSACQTPTKVSEKDMELESRVFSKIEYGKPKELKRAIIMDTRSSFDHQMSRPPRSFHAYWKDWLLRGYSGAKLDDKKNELQRLLALHGIDPLTEVVVLGKGLTGKGEEFLVASTLYSLGIERIRFMTEKQAKEAFVARNLPKVENVPNWSRPLRKLLACELLPNDEVAEKMQKADIVVSRKFLEKGGSPETYFTKDLKFKKARFPKGLRLRVYSPHTQWAYGVALHLLEQGRQPCVL